ncbi:phospholipase A2 inhibitor LNF2-like [Candoia aspera]|uniref:phospholipase A2 inhibitor LNF2-like n=1 Tax=Candoia aspera TaxID=51853 RepID=UPI002FD7D573
MKSLQTICLLFIFIAGGNSLSCETCLHYGKKCNGYPTECVSPEEQCGKILLEISEAPISLTFVSKNCFSPSICELGQIDINVGNTWYIRARINCCEKDQCEENRIPEKHTLSGSTLLPPNGFRCSGGFGLFTDNGIKHEVDCRGPEDKCLNLVGQRDSHYENIIYNIGGCVSSCPLVTLNDTAHKGHTNYLMKLECRDATKLESPN